MTLFVSATGLVNGKPRHSEPNGTKTHEPNDIKIDMGDYIRNITPPAKFGIPAPTGSEKLHEIVNPRVYF